MPIKRMMASSPHQAGRGSGVGDRHPGVQLRHVVVDCSAHTFDANERRSAIRCSYVRMHMLPSFVSPVIQTSSSLQRGPTYNLIQTCISCPRRGRPMACADNHAFIKINQDTPRIE